MVDAETELQLVRIRNMPPHEAATKRLAAEPPRTRHVVAAQLAAGAQE